MVPNVVARVICLFRLASESDKDPQAVGIINPRPIIGVAFRFIRWTGPRDPQDNLHEQH